MKRILVVVLTIILGCSPVAFGEATKAMVCAEIARQFEESLNESENLEAIVNYDTSLDAIILHVTFKSNHSTFERMRADNAIDTLYDMLLELKVYSKAASYLSQYGFSGTDVYLFFYSADGNIEYIEINGRNITELFESRDETDVCIRGAIQEFEEGFYGETSNIAPIVDVKGIYGYFAYSIFISFTYTDMTEKSLKKDEGLWDAMLRDSLNQYVEFQGILDRIGIVDTPVWFAWFDKDGNCIHVVCDEKDATSDENCTLLEQAWDYIY